jgi:hypothetical protein
VAEYENLMAGQGLEKAKEVDPTLWQLYISPEFEERLLLEEAPDDANNIVQSPPGSGGVQPLN